MNIHLSSEHYWEVTHEGMLFYCSVTEVDGKFWCGKCHCKSQNEYRRHSVPKRKQLRDDAGRKAVEYSRMARRGEWVNEIVPKFTNTNIL